MNNTVIDDQYGEDRITLLNNLKLSELNIFSQKDGSLVLTVNDSGESLTILNHMAHYNKIEYLYFSDGTSVNLAGDDGYRSELEVLA